MKSTKTIPRFGLASLALSTLAALTACGGGGGADSAATSATPTPPVAAVAKPLSVSGTVTGFGSVIIDGVTYDDSVVKVAVDNGATQGSPLPLGDLKLGMTVDATVEDGKLTQVTVRAAMSGPIERIDSAAASFSVYGQTIKVVTSGATPTLFEGVGGLSSLAVNDRVEVHGTVDASRAVVATRVERKPRDSVEAGVRLGGAVAALDASAKTFKLNELTVDYSSAAITPANQTLANGVEVVAFGSAAPASGRFTAQTLRIRGADDGAPMIVGGRVTSFVSLADFAVAGQRVNAATAVLEGGTATDIAAGQAVAAEGRVVSGVLNADKLRVIKTPLDVLASLKGEVSGFVSAGNFKLRGAIVDASAATFVGGAKEDLGDGAYVQVQGAVRGDIFLGSKVEFLKRPAAQVVKLSGDLRDWSLQGLSFKLMGLSVRLAQDAQIEGGLVAALANGRKVSIEGLANAEGVVVVSKLVIQPEVVSPTVSVVSGRAYDVTGSSFRLPGMTITHSSATIFEGGTSADVVNGALVYVKGRVSSNKQGMFASWVDVVKGDAPAARVLGSISDFSSRSSFRVNGQRVDASGAEIVDGQVSALADGVMVMATGSLVEVDGRRIFVATKLRFMQ